jgi:dolichol-phosphate mannosyltransferase
VNDPAWLVLPTYDEAENLDAIVRAALRSLAAASPEGHGVLVVDDNSPDGTGEIADALAAELDPVRVLHRPVKQGLGAAYLAGFAEVLSLGAGYVIEMDADFSHDPADLPRLLAEARAGADLVLGSRYVDGGAVAGWTWPRRLISRAGSAYARAMLGLSVRDVTAGFKCFRRRTLELIDLPSVRSHGYAFQVELTYRAVRAGLRVVEIPIAFHDRRAGTSKMSTRIALEAALLVPAMRLRAPASAHVGGAGATEGAAQAPR